MTIDHNALKRGDIPSSKFEQKNRCLQSVIYVTLNSLARLVARTLTSESDFSVVR